MIRLRGGMGLCSGCNRHLTDPLPYPNLFATYVPRMVASRGTRWSAPGAPQVRAWTRQPTQTSTRLPLRVPEALRLLLAGACVPADSRHASTRCGRWRPCCGVGADDKCFILAFVWWRLYVGDKRDRRGSQGSALPARCPRPTCCWSDRAQSLPLPPRVPESCAGRG
jgi:hypothetical protein